MDVSNVTIAQLCSEWLNMKKLSVKQSTHAKYYSIAQKHILPELGEIPLVQINSAVINDFAARKLNAGQTDPAEGGEKRESMNPKTVRDICTILKSVIRYGEKEYHLNSLVENTVLPKVKTASKEVLTARELKKIEQYLWQNQETLRCTGLLVCMYTGMRLGEICALKWDDIDLRHHILHINHTIQRIKLPGEQGMHKTQLILDQPKTVSSERIIPIPNTVYPLIKNLSAGSRRECYFLTNSEHLIEPRNYQYFFKRLLETLGIRNVNFHILRHTFASRCVETGMDIKTLSEILGHANTSITLNYYVHSSLDSKKKQINRLKY